LLNLQHNTEYQTTNTMGFKQIINSKKLLALFAVFMLSGTNILMAQATTATADAGKPGVDWLGVSYYILLFVLAGYISGCYR
jgi:cytochrome c oxidase subunit 2